MRSEEEIRVEFPPFTLYMSEKELRDVRDFLLENENNPKIPDKYRFVMNRTWKKLDDQMPPNTKDYSVYGLKCNPFEKLRTEPRKPPNDKGEK